MSFLQKVQASYKIVANNHDYFTAEELDSESFDGLQEDYEEVANPDHSIRTLAKASVDKCVKSLPFWDRVSLYYSDDLDDQYLAKLRGETESQPIIIVSPKNILTASKKYNVPVETTVETTIFHEYGHAVVALAEVEEYDLEYTDEEEFVEEYAHGMWTGDGSSAEDKFRSFLNVFLGN